MLDLLKLQGQNDTSRKSTAAEVVWTCVVILISCLTGAAYFPFYSLGVCNLAKSLRCLELKQENMSKFTRHRCKSVKTLFFEFVQKAEIIGGAVFFHSFQRLQPLLRSASTSCEVVNPGVFPSRLPAQFSVILRISESFRISLSIVRF